LRREPLSYHRKVITPKRLALVFGDLLACLVRRDVEALLAEGALERRVPTRRVIVRDVITGIGEEHRLLPVGLCPICGPQAKDASKLALAPTPKAGRGLRTVIHPPTDVLKEALVNERIGVVARVTIDATEPQAIATAALPLPEFGRVELGVGRAETIDHASGVAIIEALERFAGIRPRRALPYVEAPYEDLDGTALDPRKLILHEREQYRQDGFPFHEFTEDLRLRWITAFSLVDQQPILIPQHSAYYGLPDVTGNPQLAYDLSNGCASGSCLVEAILHGALEVIERDSFLMAWYSGRVGPRIDLATLAVRETCTLLARLTQLGYEVACFDITQPDLGIPAVWLFARASAGGKPWAASAAGASLDMEEAIARGVRELASSIRTLEHRVTRDSRYPVWLAEDFGRVRSMEDHALVYAVREGRRPLSFLERARRQASAPVRTQEVTNDLLCDLRELVACAGTAGIDLIVVDQTSPEHESVSLRCVRVLMPGLLPMTFGQDNRRIAGAERLQVLSGDAINPAPHPFP
jgi:ribosomal protein S12 methylthiotransferase accessory factor